MSYETQLVQLREAMHPTVTCSGSHGNEDAILRALLPDDPVVYVDVGANEPEQANNTWQFYQAGGYGLLIEPLPKYWHALLRHRFRDQLCPVAVADCNGISDLRVSVEGNGSGSTLDPNWNIKEQGRIPVETDTLASVLARYPDIRDTCQLCDIDVEGLEWAVLAGIDWATFRPLVFCIEYIAFHPEHAGPDISDRWSHILIENGYFEGIRTAAGNIIYVRNDLRSRWNSVKENLQP